MTKKDRVYELARDLFLKCEKPGIMLNEANKPMYIKAIKNCIETAELFEKTYKEEVGIKIEPYYGD